MRQERIFATCKMLNSTTSLRKKIAAVARAMCNLILLYFLTQYTGGKFFSASRKVKKNRESYRQTSSEKNIFFLQCRL